MVNQVHKDAVIGIKKLSEADLGTNSTSNQTHIGLFEDTLVFLDIDPKMIPSQLIYQNQVLDVLALLDYIQTPSGAFRSPKIRKGNEQELRVGNQRVNSVVREVRSKVQISPSSNWFLLWLVLDTNELVFLLFQENSLDYKEIVSIIGNLGSRNQIPNTSANFNDLVNYLNTKIEIVNAEYYEELEVTSQTGQNKITKRLILRPRDIEKMNKVFQAIGKEGESLLNQYLESEKQQKRIKDFNWLNKSREMYMPYDFEIIQNNDARFFSDVKSTNQEFEKHRPIYLSENELKFIDINKKNYLIHRVYSVGTTPKFRMCNNIHIVSDIFLPNYEKLVSSLEQKKLSIKGVQLAVPTNLDKLNFDEEVILF